MKRRKLYCASNYSSPTSFPYKGRRIKLLSDGSGWAIFDTDGELWDSGFKTKQAACKSIDEYDNIYQPVQAGTDEIVRADIVGSVRASTKTKVTASWDEDDSEWIKLNRKPVLDSDGFYTDYTLYTNGHEYICMFGDEDLYGPDPDYADFSTDSEEEAMEWFDSYEGFEDEEDDDIYDDIYDICSSEEVDDELEHPDQEYDSAATSINSNKLPAIYKMVNFEPGKVYLDFGGGKFDNGVYFVKDKGATLLVYDPYNRSDEHNKQVLAELKENGGADAGLNSNVLNVIKEPEARLAVLRNLKRMVKPGGDIYITVYEGSGKGNEGPTKAGYQLNRKTEGYMDEVRQIFPDAQRKGKLIHAVNSSTQPITITLGTVTDKVYWYFTRHGVQPGSIPRSIDTLYDVIDTPEGTYFATNTILNTKELSEYEIKEKWLPEKFKDQTNYFEHNTVVSAADQTSAKQVYCTCIFASDTDIDAEEFKGLSREQIERILDEAPVGAKVLHIRNLKNRFNMDAVIRKKQAYKSNYFNPVGAPRDFNNLDTYWELSGYEDPYIDSTIYKAVNGKDKYYGLTSEVLKAHGITSASYGGAYDILDDYYFTRDDLIDFGEEVVFELENLEPGDYFVNDLDMLNPKTIHIEVYCRNKETYADKNIVIDMRRIQKPSDLNKYAYQVALDMYDEFSEYDDVYSSSDYQIMKKSYKNSRKFRSQGDAEYLDFLDELDHKGVAHDQYDNLKDDGCTVFYDEPKTPIVSSSGNGREFVQLPIFTKAWEYMGLSDAHLRDLESLILSNPDGGDIIPGSGGARKIRFQIPDKGKRGGARVIYVDFIQIEKVYLITAYPKSEKSNLSPKEINTIKEIVFGLE